MRFACWILTGILLGVFGVVTAYLLRERRLAGRDLPAYSVYSEASDGLGEAAYVLRRLGWTPAAVTRPPPFSPPKVGGEGGGVRLVKGHSGAG